MNWAREGGEPGTMFPPDCVGNRLCFACARLADVNGEQEFAGGARGEGEH